MVRLREIPRTATFAWSTGSASPLIATGTRAGAVDANFSNETQLEVWDLDLSNADQGTELQPAGSISVDSRRVECCSMHGNGMTVCLRVTMQVPRSSLESTERGSFKRHNSWSPRERIAGFVGRREATEWLRVRCWLKQQIARSDNVQRLFSFPHVEAQWRD